MVAMNGEENKDRPDEFSIPYGVKAISRDLVSRVLSLVEGAQIDLDIKLEDDGFNMNDLVNENVLKHAFASSIIDMQIDLMSGNADEWRNRRRRLTLDNFELQKSLLGRYAHVLLRIIRKEVLPGDLTVTPPSNAADGALFSHAGIRYEVAFGLMGELISHFAAKIALEEESDNPDTQLIAEWGKEQSTIRLERQNLGMDDSAAIEQSINACSLALRLLD
jgi:hypothetical protein